MSLCYVCYLLRATLSTLHVDIDSLYINLKINKFKIPLVTTIVNYFSDTFIHCSVMS